MDADDLSRSPERPEQFGGFAPPTTGGPPVGPPPAGGMAPVDGGPPAPPGPPPNGPLVTLAADDYDRNRLLVFFRIFAAIPHFIWLGLWGGIMFLLSPVLWIITLIKGQPPEGLHEVYGMFVRYALHFYAWFYLAVDKYPGFLGRPRSATVDVDIPPPAKMNRWSVGFRFFLALPPLLLTQALVGGGPSGNTSTQTTQSSTAGSEVDPTLIIPSLGAAAAVAFLAWWVCLFKGRMPGGFRDLLIWGFGYSAQVYGYLFLLTAKYPNSDPAVAPVKPVPPNPLRLRLTDSLARNRLTVFFRLILAFPHFVWATLWGVLVVVAAIVAWLVALIIGRVPVPLHNFISAYVRYSSHLFAFVYLAGGPFPGFVGTPGSYPVDIEIDGPRTQSRWKTLFRFFLAIPALLVSSGLGTAMLFAAIAGWWVGLFTGRMPQGLRNLNAYSVRYSAQTYAYLMLVTDVYPYSGPGDFHGEAAKPAEPAPAPGLEAALA